MTSYTVTLYKLFLGDQDTTTGHYDMGYTIHSISCALFPSGGAFNFGSLGFHTVNGSVGFTEYDVDEGDVILDGFGKYFEVKSLKPWTSGNTFSFYELDLVEKPDFPFIAGFFGFEDATHGTYGGQFEDGFERGYWAL